MEFLFIGLGVVAVIVFIILLIVFIRFLFTNFILSRILSLACCIASIVLAFVISNSENVEYGPLIATTITTVFGWLFNIGPVVFDVEWDGTVTPLENGDFKFNQVGGFFFNLFAAALIVVPSYIFGGPEFPAIYFILPLLIIAINVIYVIIAVRASR